MNVRYAKPTFSVDRFDKDGDDWETGVYLHFGIASVKVADTPEEFGNFVAHLKFMESEIVSGTIGEVPTKPSNKIS